jgi:type IV pili sensor histidine kinase/response regulator
MEPEPEAQVLPVPRDWIPVVRYGRYTLVELAPQVAQQNLLFQVVDVSMSATLQATVGDALRHLVLRSGYSLCDDDPAIASLHDLPLPAAHRQLGPLFLRDALLTLAGPAWDLQVDDVTRQLCFVRADTADSAPPAVDASTVEPATTLSATAGGQP